MIRRWREIERWIEAGAVGVRASAYPMLPLSEVLTERHEALQLTEGLGEWQTITIKFSGEVIPRGRESVFKGAMFAAYPGDLVFSKIDARNGAVGLIPASIPKVVVTSEYPVLIHDAAKIRASYLHLLLRAKHFLKSLKRKATGHSGRKRVTPEGFLDLVVPVPRISEQEALEAAYYGELNGAAKLDREAQANEDASWQSFQSAVGAALPTAQIVRPAFVASFKNLERWSHESISRAQDEPLCHGTGICPTVRLGDVISDLENGWSPKCHEYPAKGEVWGVLKLGAVSFGVYDESQNKELPERLAPRPEYEVKSGDVLISRANVVRYVGACVYVESTRDKLMICDKIFRVKFFDGGDVLPQYLAEVMKLPSVREQIEARLTGMSPTMKNISKPALLDLQIPLPEIDVQRSLVSELSASRSGAIAKRHDAEQLKARAWERFESVLFDA